MGAAGTRRRNPRARVAALIALAWCVLVVGALLVLPLGTTTTTTTTASSDRSVSRVERHTLVDREGIAGLAATAIPLAVAAVGVAAVGRRRERGALVTTMVLLWVWVVLTGFSIGLFYLPAAVASCFAVAASRSSQRTCSMSVT